MRIALVTSSFLPKIGGAEFVVHHLATQWSLQGHTVVVINSESNEATYSEGLYSVRKYLVVRGATRFGYHRFPWRLLAIRSLGAAINAFKPDYVSAHFGYPVAVWMARLKLTCPYSVTCHGPGIVIHDSAPRVIYPKLDKELADAYESADGMIAISSYVRKTMIELGVNESKIHLLPNGVDLPKFRSTAMTNIRELFGMTDNAKIIISVGSYREAKGYKYGIEAFKSIAEIFSDLYYLIVGSRVSDLQDTISTSGLDGRVILCNGLRGDALIAAFQQADVFFSPSLWEVCPLVVLEAIAAKLPCVVTNVSGSQDLVKSGVNGFVVEPKDIVGISGALSKLLVQYELRLKFGVKNSKLVEQYSWDKISRKQLDIFNIS